MTYLSQEPNSEEEARPKESQSIQPFISIEEFYVQIQTVPILIQQAVDFDQGLSNHCQGLQQSAGEVLNQLHYQKALILTQFDSWLMPLAKEILDDLLGEAEQLKLNLEEALLSFSKIREMDWIEYAKCWARLCAKWNDRDELNQQVLRLVSDRTKQLIDKDIRVIQDYQNQSLSRVAQQGDAFKSVETRLAKATEAPLKLLMKLKGGVTEDASLKQASEWIAQLRSHRESCFDQLLVKIDLIVKDMVLVDEELDGEVFKEAEGEMHFVEQELKHIHELLPKLQKDDEKEFYFTETRLEGLKDHLDQFHPAKFPRPLKERLEKLCQNIDLTLFRLKQRKMD